METWNCSECTFSNHACLLSCELCETPKHKSNSIQKENSNRLLLENDDENNDNNSDKPDAICNQCIYANHDTANKHQCNLCESLRPNYFDNNNTNTKYDDFECALHVIIACAQNDESVINILETLKVITSRITDKNPKYRVLDTSTQSVQCRLLGFEGSLEYLELLGYSLDVSTGKFKCFKHPPQHILHKVIILINSHLHKLKADEKNVSQLVALVTHPEELADDKTVKVLLLVHKCFSDSLELIECLRKRFFCATWR
eukprot:147383_1